jgi:phosphatidylinositol-3-phosphatase
VTVNAQVVGSNIKYVFTILMENNPASAIYGSSSCPYINNTLLPMAGYATQYTDPPGSDLVGLHVSEPHYVWMEAGTNVFADVAGGSGFLTDSDPSSSNSTASTAHLTAQLNTANISWTAYQEGLPNACPVKSSSGSPDWFASKHDPFVFFQDIAGSPPSSTNSLCAAHHKDYSALAADLSAKTVAKYNFITPNLCDDMHGASGCNNGCGSSTCPGPGDTWLSNNLPSIISFVNANQGIIFLAWDEGEGTATTTQAFLVIGPNVKTGANSTAFNHGSLLKSTEEIFGVPVLSTVTSENDFSSFFQPGKFP